MATDSVRTNESAQQSAHENGNDVSKALEAIKQLAADHPEIVEPIRTASSTDDVRRILHDHGIEISSETLWLHRGVLFTDGQPTWRG